MELPIKSVVWTSLIDYPGKISTVIFTGGCNLKCGYCHNKELVIDPHLIPDIPEDDIITHLIENVKTTKGVVISGGEPCFHGIRLHKFIEKIRNNVSGIFIKLDTNGTYPYVLKKIIDKNLVDFVAIDIKTTWDKYSSLTKCTDNDIKGIQQSIKILTESSISHEYRTTLVPGYTDQIDIEDIAGQTSKLEHNMYSFNSFRPMNCIDNKFNKKIPFSVEEERILQEIFGDIYDKVDELDNDKNENMELKQNNIEVREEGIIYSKILWKVFMVLLCIIACYYFCLFLL